MNKLMEERNDMIDMHSHSTHSDGTYKVFQILDEAEKLKLAILSITDHNSVEAYYDLEEKNIRNKFKGVIIPGCEVTTTYNGEVIEILGYGLEYKKFREKLANIRLSDRDRRLRKYKVSCLTVDTLYEKGVKFRDNFIDEIYTNPEQFYDARHEGIMDAILNEIRRFPDNAKYFGSIEKMENISTKDFVRKMIYNPKSDFYIDQRKLYPSLQNVIKIIHECGGLAFLAHIYIYSDTIEENLEKLVNSYDLDGLECYYTTFSQEQVECLKTFCINNKLYMSGGSDFHGEKKINHYLGVGSGNLKISTLVVKEWIDKVKEVI